MTTLPMTIDELKIILEREQFLPETYSLTGGRHQDAHCISQENDKWVVYYSERGEKYHKVYFNSEGEACEYLLHEIRRDIGCKLPNA
jgi:hypothetical protein